MEDDNKNLISLEYNKIVNLLEKYCKTYIGRKKLFNMKPHAILLKPNSGLSLRFFDKP